MRCALGVLMTMGRFCAVALVLATSLGAQSRIRTDVDTTLVTVGDRITLTVSVQHAVGTSVVWPDSVSLGSFEVLAARALPTQADGDGSRSVAVFSLAAFELGALEIPSFDVTVVASDGSSETLSTDRYGIEVVTVGADETGDIREIRGPLGIPLSTVVVALWGLVILIVGALAYMLFRRFRRSGPVADEPAPGPPPRPAHEIALEALVRIESSHLLDRGQVKEYHIGVSDVLRRYVEARFGVTALELTTWEIIEGLERSGVASDFREGLRRFLDQCDLVKFAKVRPGADASRDVLARGRQLVEASIAVATADADEDVAEEVVFA